MTLIKVFVTTIALLVTIVLGTYILELASNLPRAFNVVIVTLLVISVYDSIKPFIKTK